MNRSVWTAWGIVAAIWALAGAALALGYVRLPHPQYAEQIRLRDTPQTHARWEAMSEQAKERCE